MQSQPDSAPTVEYFVHSQMITLYVEPLNVLKCTCNLNILAGASLWTFLHVQDSGPTRKVLRSAM